jgi:hypothetical protein
MSPGISPRQVAERGGRRRGTLVGIVVESAFALSLFGLGFLVCAAAAAFIAARV